MKNIANKIIYAKKIVLFCIWPFLVFGGIFLNYFLVQLGYKLELSYLLSVVVFILLVAFLEWVLPYNKNWKNHFNQALLNDALFFGLNQIITSIIFPVLILFFLWIISFFLHSYNGIWPTNWPLLKQIILALIISDFGSYWSHRLFHRVSFFWAFHSIHHNLKHLSLVNAYTNHPVDNLRDIIPLLIPIIILGAPKEVLLWHTIISSFITILLHCNIKMHCGIFNYIFNTPELHRWHHSIVVKEANNNYSFNLILWDIVFGTYYLPKQAFSKDVGIVNALPQGFIKQLLFPIKNIEG